ncbi:MAG: sulfatase-like hydrolase/transferase [Acidobacteriota bacterium]|nr:sulfatase-like hydrolase/transferase [Acidobacteriota bacterium]
MKQVKQARQAGRVRQVPRVVLVLAGALVLAAAGFFGWRALETTSLTTVDGAEMGALPRGVAPGDLNVILITMDTTRADAMGYAGAGGNPTPTIDGLAREGVTFDNAVASVPLTLPSHSTIFTGVLPPRHGVRDNGGFVLDPKHVTLAERLRDRGWKTGGFVGAYVLDAKWGIDQGFEHYYDQFDLSKYKRISLGDVARTAGEVVDAAMPWLEQNARNKFFAWMHFYDPHTPYAPPEPYKGRFEGRPYLGEVAYVDAQIARVTNWLTSRGLMDRTIIIVTADHGESLGEHGEGTHGLFVYDATMKVPMVMRTPYAASKGRKVSQVVRSHDITPTVLELLGLPSDPVLEGRSLAPLLAGGRTEERDAYSESLYARHHYGWSELTSLRAGRFKYIEAPRPELYDLEQDPGEKDNLFDARKPLAERLGAELLKLSAEDVTASGATQATVDPETRERLAALGYIGSFVATPKVAGQKLADPKDKIQIFNLMFAANENAGKETPADTIARFNKVLAEDPNVLDAWIMLGNEYFKARDYPSALEKYQRALAINPDYDLATVNLAGAYRAMGNFTAAALGYERYLEKDPKNAFVVYQLGELYLDMNRLDDAEKTFRRAIALDERVASAENALGVVAFKRGQLDQAETHAKSALARSPDAKLAHYNLALIAEQRGNHTAAKAEYRQEIEQQPDAWKAAFNLARLHEQLGERTEAEQAYRKALEIHPRFAEGYFYLAKLCLDTARLDEAAFNANKGLEIAPASQFAPLGHYVLADVFSRQGKHAQAAREAERGKALENRAKTKD